MNDSSGPPVLQVRVHRDGLVLDRFARQLDDLYVATGAPVTARRTWHQAWLRAHRQWSVLVVTVHRADELAAAAVLAVRRNRLYDDVRPVGAGSSDEVRLPARDDVAAQLLATGITDALAGLQRPWLLTLRDLPAGDPVVARLNGALACAAVVPGDVSPRLVLGADRSLRPYLSRNHTQQSRRLCKKIDKDGLKLEVHQLSSVADLVMVLPEMERICRARDYQVRQFSVLDDPAGLALFRDLLVSHAARGEVELTTLRLDGELASYDLCFRDGDAWRMWNCRFDPVFARYSPGRLAHEESVTAALAQGATLYDWMRGEEPYKAAMSDHMSRAEDLFAASNRVLWAATDGARRSYRALREIKNSRPELVERWERLRPLIARVRHSPTARARAQAAATESGRPRA